MNSVQFTSILFGKQIVRRINHLIKARAHSVHWEALGVLLALRIKNVNLDQEKEDEIQSKKLQNKKSRVLNLSKKERKVSVYEIIQFNLCIQI